MTKDNGTARKHDRVLEIYTRLLSGEIISKTDLAKEYGVSPRSIQRDIESVRNFYSDRAARGDAAAEIRYSHLEKGFRITGVNKDTLTNAELFTIAKIILESRSLSKSEMESIINKLNKICPPANDRKKLKDLVLNEIFHYVEPRHGKNLINTIWEFGTAVYSHKKIQIKYKKSNGDITKALIKPVGIMESEYYFYLIAYIGDNDKKYPGYPTIYRVDRIESYKITEDVFHVPYKDRFEEGEFRKRIPFMYGGKLHKRSFVYKGSDINAVLDRLPTANILNEHDGIYTISVEVFGDGIDMWIRSQGDYIKVLEE